MSITISLPEELENRVKQQVETGAYSSASELIREALLLLERYQTLQSSQYRSLKADIDQGLADLAAGRVAELDMNDLTQQGRQILANRRNA